jgi:hypothetical protein
MSAGDSTALDGMPDFELPEFPEEVRTLDLQREHQKYFMPDGREVTGATTILKVLGLSTDALMGFAARCAREGLNHRDVSQEARDIGTIAHWMIQNRLECARSCFDGLNVNQVEMAMWATDSFMQEWKYGFGPGRVICEKQLVSAQYGFGGTIDLLVPDPEAQGQYILADIKTAKGIYTEHWLQVAGYGVLAAEAGYSISKYEIWRPCKEPMAGYKCEVQAKTPAEIEPYREAFLRCVPLYEALQKLPKSKTEYKPRRKKAQNK